MNQHTADARPLTPSPANGRVNGVHPWAALTTPRIDPPRDSHVHLQPLVLNPASLTPTVAFTAEAAQVRPVEVEADAVGDDEKRATTAQLAKAVVPLLVVNALAVYGQLAYAMEHIAPGEWPIPARVALSIGFAAAVESVALYVGWHAHDALLMKGYATARRLRRWSFAIAAVVGAMNYAHFAAEGMRPTAAACAFGLLSLLSPWMWGLHTRRQQHIQLLKERKVDETGAEFSTERRRHFPIRTLLARRWSIDHNVTDPGEAWRGYNAERRNRLSTRPTDRLAVGSETNCPTDCQSPSEPTAGPTNYPTVEATSRSIVDRLNSRPARRPRHRLEDRQVRTVQRRRVPTAQLVSTPTDRPTAEPTAKATGQSLEKAEFSQASTEINTTEKVARQSVRQSPRKHSLAAVENAAILRSQYGDRLVKSASAMRNELGWSHARITPAIAAHKAKADLKTNPPNGA